MYRQGYVQAGSTHKAGAAHQNGADFTDIVKGHKQMFGQGTKMEKVNKVINCKYCGALIGLKWVMIAIEEDGTLHRLRCTTKDRIK